MAKKRKSTLFSSVAVILAALFVIGYTSSNKENVSLENGNLEVHYIDVGQADSELVLCDGETMLIDGGNVDDSSLIVSYLQNLGIDHLDYLICTHAHEDHVGGLAGALNQCTADRVICPTSSYDSKAFGNFKKYTEAQGKSIEIPHHGDVLKIGQGEAKILAPVFEYQDTNNTSIVMKLTYGDTSFLFTGDAERESEHDIIDAGYDLSADVLKVGHHGSSTSTSYVFLREIMPQYAVISCGKGNKYGHPHEETLSRLRDADVTTLRTDESGTIIVRSDGQNITVETEK